MLTLSGAFGRLLTDAKRMCTVPASKTTRICILTTLLSLGWNHVMLDACNGSMLGADRQAAERDQMGQVLKQTSC
jgi:hypothetical protein